MECAVQRVFGIPELLELILEFSCAGENWNESIKLREVCRFWRDNSFKALTACKRRHGIDISQVLDKFPGKCDIPLQIILTGDIDSKIISFVKVNGSVISGIDISDFSVNNPVKNSLKLELPNLKSVTVEFPREFRFKQFRRLRKLLDLLVQNAPRLQRFSITMDAVDKVPVNLALPSKTTHLLLSARNLQSSLNSLITADFQHLKDLDLVPLKPTQADLEKVKEVFDKYSNQLNNSKLVLTNVIRDGPRLLRIPSIPSLKEIRTKPFEMVKIRGFSNNFFLDFRNLTALSLAFGNFLDLIKPGITLEHLKSFFVCGEMTQATEGEFETLKSLGSFDFPKLEQLVCKYFKCETLSHFLPRFFENSKCLRSLYVNVLFHSPWQLTSMLAMETIPVVHRSEWPTYENRLEAFTNLKCLESFSLSNESRRYKYDIEPFIFRCAFLKMPNLKKLNVTRNIGVKKTLARDWKNEGRKLRPIPNLTRNRED